MPRTTTLECPGCPPIRALTFDVLGLIKVIEATASGSGREVGVPKVVDRWGDPDSSKCVLAASIDDSKSDPLLAVARKCGTIDICSPLNGDVRTEVSCANDSKPEEDPIVGLHLFRRQGAETATGSCTLLSCTVKGIAQTRSFNVANLPEDSISMSLINRWNVSNGGNILCCKVDGNENFAVFGGKGIEVNIWDLEKCVKIWTAKSPPRNSLGIFSPTWFTSATFLCKDDHRKIVAGTNSHQVHLYDVSAQRRPVLSFDFRESPIKTVAEDLDGYTVYVGNGSGDMASFDMRTGKLLGCFLGKCSGSIRSIARHPTLPVVASCGLDSYLRFWDVKSRQLLSAVYLKQHLNCVVFDANFSDEAEPSHAILDQSLKEAENEQDIELEDEDVQSGQKKKKFKKGLGLKKKASEENDVLEKLKLKKKRKKLKD